MGGYYNLEWPLTDLTNISCDGIYKFCQQILISYLVFSLFQIQQAAVSAKAKT